MTERREYNLLQTYLRTMGYLVSTGYRQSSAMVNDPPWYFETLVWEWNNETKETDRILYSENSGSTQNEAFRQHQIICRKLWNDEPLEEDQ